MANELTNDENTPPVAENNDSGAPAAPGESETFRSSTMAPKPERRSSGSAMGMFFAALKKALMPWTWNWKARPSVYTVMLALSLVFVTIGCAVLWLELQQWGDYPWWKTTESIPQGGG